MLKVVYFKVDSILKPKSVKAMKNQVFYDDLAVTEFIASIGEENVVSISHLNQGHSIPACAIFYHDNELLTCPECGKEISNRFKFCPECGVKLK